MSDRTYWAKLSTGRNSAALWGPHSTREAAIEAVRASRSVMSERQAKFGKITSGYGTFGPSFDIRWNPVDPAREPAPH